MRDNPEHRVARGILLRVAMYLNDRSYFMDEASLAENLKNKPILDFSGGLSGDQLAPMGFLIAERAIMGGL